MIPASGAVASGAVASGAVGGLPLLLSPRPTLNAADIAAIANALKTVLRGYL